MLVNKDSRPWIIWCLLILGGATFVYFVGPYGHNRLNGPSGGSWLGIIFGALGSAMMLYALLLGARKRVRTMRIGRAYWWMQGHVWLGLLSYPIILYHAGFKWPLWGGPLTQVIMWVFTVVIVSGIVGLVIQQYMPTKMMRDVPMETIHDQIGHVLEQLRGEAESLVASVEARPEERAYERDSVPAGTAVATLLQRSGTQAAAQLRTFHDTHLVPFLKERVPAGSRLSTPSASDDLFAELSDLMPPALKKTVQDLRDIAEERRQLALQRRMHRILHGWLLVHVPLSYGLAVLATVHAVTALSYASLRW